MWTRPGPGQGAAYYRINFLLQRCCDPPLPQGDAVADLNLPSNPAPTVNDAVGGVTKWQWLVETRAHASGGQESIRDGVFGYTLLCLTQVWPAFAFPSKALFCFANSTTFGSVGPGRKSGWPPCELECARGWTRGISPFSNATVRGQYLPPGGSVSFILCSTRTPYIWWGGGGLGSLRRRAAASLGATKQAILASGSAATLAGALAATKSSMASTRVKRMKRHGAL